MFEKINNLFKKEKIELATLEKNHYIIENAEERHKETPKDFDMPDKKLRSNLQANDIVKLIFKMETVNNHNAFEVERMWVQVLDKKEYCYIGLLDNDPYGDVYLKSGQTIYFQAKHIIDIFEG